jgi:serine/threonine protein kinase/beta-lactam-binding protein with PASTA domain
MTAQARLLGGRYQVGELLGYGGMAEVHKGRDLRLGRDVAIKMLRTDLARDATFQERFRREAQNSAALNHPAIVAVYDTGEEISSTGEKLPFIVMEFVKGRTLKEVLAAEQRIQPRRALEMIADISAALEFSHRHGIIHRDIKPGNVMITQNGQVKVMDFGIARALASGATTMTQTSAVIGTAQYLSPEQARGESVDARSDVYAAGCVLFELLVGHPPFVGDSPVSVAYQHVREDPKAPSDINRDVPPDVDAIVLKALAKNPLNRYQSAQEMRADALRAVAGRPVLATPVMTEAETMAMGGAQRYMPQSAATTINRPIPGGMPPPGPPDRKMSSWLTAVLAALGVLAVVALGIGLALSRGNDNKDDNTVSTVQMPQLIGQSEADAKAQLAQQKFTNVTRGPDVADDNCGDKPKVVQQNPQPNTSLKVDQAVTYQVCKGPDQVRVPANLVGSTKDAADQQLRSIKLVPKFTSVDDVAPKDQVLSVDKQGELVNPGSEIQVKISKNNQVIMQDVTNRTQDVAEAILQNLGSINVNVKTVTQGGAPGTVIAQSVAPGKKITRGSSVTLTVVQDNPDPGTSQTPSPGSSGTGAGDGSGDGNPINNLLHQ